MYVNLINKLEVLIKLSTCVCICLPKTHCNSATSLSLMVIAENEGVVNIMAISISTLKTLSHTAPLPSFSDLILFWQNGEVFNRIWLWFIAVALEIAKENSLFSYRGIYEYIREPNTAMKKYSMYINMKKFQVILLGVVKKGK